MVSSSFTVFLISHHYSFICLIFNLKKRKKTSCKYLNVNPKKKIKKKNIIISNAKSVKLHRQKYVNMPVIAKD